MCCFGRKVKHPAMAVSKIPCVLPRKGAWRGLSPELEQADSLLVYCITNTVVPSEELS